MNEPAVRLEEQIISLFLDVKTFVLPDNVDIGDILRFSVINRMAKVKGAGRPPSKGGTAGTI